jgi:hypothetical protein
MALCRPACARRNQPGWVAPIIKSHVFQLLHSKDGSRIEISFDMFPMALFQGCDHYNVHASSIHLTGASATWRKRLAGPVLL